MSARLALIAIAAALVAVVPSASAQTACGGPLLPPCPTPTPNPTPSPTPTPPSGSGRKPAEISITASRTRLFYESPDVPRLRLSGRLRSTASVRHVKLDVVGRTPGGRVAVRKRTRTDRQGRYAFDLKARTSATYLVRVRPAQKVRGSSVKLLVRLQPDVRIGNATAGSGLRIKGAVLTPDPPQGPAVRPGPQTLGHFYLKLRDEDFFREVGTGEVGPIRCRRGECVRRTAHVVRKRSLLRRAERVLVCFGGKPYRDVGTTGRCPSRFAA